MDSRFEKYIEVLHSSFERLIAMNPVSVSELPTGLPKSAVYVFSDGDRHMYAGRSNSLRNRLRQHTTDGAQHNQAVFAFKLAREKVGKIEATYKPEGSRASLAAEPEFAAAFLDEKRRVRKMNLRFVEESDQLRQALLEIYVSFVLGTPYNDFRTH